MVLVELNLAGAIGTGKKARIMRSKSHVTKLFVIDCALVSVGAVHAV